MKRFRENPIKSLKMKERNILKVLETYTREKHILKKIPRKFWKHHEDKLKEKSILIWM